MKGKTSALCIQNIHFLITLVDHDLHIYSLKFEPWFTDIIFIIATKQEIYFKQEEEKLSLLNDLNKIHTRF